MIDEDMINDLWQVQKAFDITFKMPIPRKIEEKNAESFEKEGQMVPGITLMYDDLKNNPVNWNRVAIEKEKFALIGDKDVSEQLSLFSLEKSTELDIETIKKMDHIGIATHCYSKTMKKASNDQYILKLIKKKSCF